MPARRIALRDLLQSARVRLSRRARLWRHFDKRPLVAVALFGAVSFLAVAHIRPGASYRSGDLARTDIYAPLDLAWVDEAGTEQIREQARRSAPKEYIGRRGETREAELTRLTRLFDEAESAAQALASAAVPLEPARVSPESGDGAPPRSAGVLLRARYTTLVATDHIDLGYSAFATLARLRVEERAAVRSAVVQALARINDERDLRSDEVAQYMGAVRDALAGYAEQRLFGLPATREAAEVFADAAAACVLPNLEYSPTATEQARESAARAVEPVLIEVRKGDLLVPKRQRISEADLAKLERLGLANPRIVWTTAALTVLLVFAGLSSGALLLQAFDPSSLQGARKLGVVSGLVLVPALTLNLAATELYAAYIAFAVGLFATLAGTVLLGILAANVLAGALLLVAALILQPTHTVGLVAIIAGSVTGMVVARRLTYAVAQIIPLGLASGVVAFAAITLAEMVFRGDAAELAMAGGLRLVLAAEWCLGVGLAGVFAGYMGSRCLEHSLGTVTEMRLLELSDPRQPVLQELLAKAPGTYHGSLVVSNLAGNAAQAAGQSERDVLLVRVGGLYHDIGKIRRPHMFVENQHGGYNPHDGIAPSLSARAIVSHIADGIEIAQIHHLPAPLVDCIREHHGTTLIGFFYQKALEGVEPGAEEAHFRYPGPRPRAATTGIIMLADGVEAAVRALRAPTRQAIEDTVGRIVRSRLEDGQLDDCPLTIRQIKGIEASMVTTLLGIYHARIEYPQPSEERPDGPPPAPEHADG